MQKTLFWLTRRSNLKKRLPIAICQYDLAAFDIVNMIDVTRIALFHRRLWVLDGVTGRVVTGWPVKVATSLSAPVLVTRLSHTAVPSLVSCLSHYVIFTIS